MNSRSAGLGKWVCLLCLLPLLRCWAGSVRLLNGETHSGKVSFSGNALAVTDATATATFDLANILVADFGENGASEAASFPEGVILSNGSFVVGTIRALDGLTVQLGAAPQQTAVPMSSVSAVVFSPTPRATISRVPNGKTGAVFSDGDFFEGEISGIKNNIVTINSPLFGPQRFAVGTRVSAVVLRGIQPGAPRYEISAKNGTRYFASDLMVTGDGIALNDTVFGQAKIAEKDLDEIRAGSGRHQLLSDLKPVAAVTASGADATKSVSVQDEGDGLRALSAGANVAVSYAIPPGFNTFLCRIAVPQESPPRTRLVFSVSCDGIIVFRSNPVAPGSNPQNLRVNLGTARRMTLRAEPAQPDSGAAAGKWIEPILLHP